MRGRPNKREKTLRVFAWLVRTFPTPYPVALKFSRQKMEEEHASCSRVGRRLIITLDPRTPITYAYDFLLHEYAHAMTWRHARVESRKVQVHDGEWGLAFAEVYRRFHDERGYDEAMS